MVCNLRVHGLAQHAHPRRSQVCEQCGGSNPIRHHDDYTKPLEIRWLCRNCHAQLHGKLRSQHKHLPGEVFDWLKISVFVTPELHRAIKMKAVASSTTIQDVAVLLFSDWVYDPLPKRRNPSKKEAADGR